MTIKGSADLDVLIIGAGIGGLTLAHALIQRGKNVRVLESAPALETVGAGIQISPNAVKVLRALGLEKAVTANAFQPRAIEARICLLYTSPSPRDLSTSRMPSSA